VMYLVFKDQDSMSNISENLPSNYLDTLWKLQDSVCYYYKTIMIDSRKLLVFLTPTANLGAKAIPSKSNKSPSKVLYHSRTT
jgi:hypothetical protein